MECSQPRSISIKGKGGSGFMRFILLRISFVYGFSGDSLDVIYLLCLPRGQIFPGVLLGANELWVNRNRHVPPLIP